MRKQLMKISEYQRLYFVAGSAPTKTTVARWIENGILAGEQLGKTYYVDAAKLDLTGNPLVDSVLLAS